MFKPVEKEILGQISLTGMRALALISLLVEAPRSLEEIREEFIKLNILEETNSNDILRIDLNTLRNAGYEISRASARTNYKYVLLKHPFGMNITPDEVNLLKKFYKRIKEKNDIDILIKYDSLFKKIAGCICDEKVKESVLGISIFNRYNLELVKDLIIDARYNNIVDLTYRKAGAKIDSVKEIAVRQIVFKNDKMYLYGLNLQSEETVTLLINKIIKILGRKPKREDIDLKTIKVKYHLRSFGIDALEPEETILESNENGFIIEGRYYNEFWAAQRILSFGAKCTVLEPADFKRNIIKKITEMGEVYGV